MLTEQEICEEIVAHISEWCVEELPMFTQTKDEGENCGSNFWYDLEWKAELTGSAEVLSMLQQLRDKWAGDHKPMPTAEDLFLLDELGGESVEITIVSRDSDSVEFSTTVEFCGAWAEFQG